MRYFAIHCYDSCDFFFFSSRRRHTRCLSDWSSDVCSSDLAKLKQNQTGVRYGGPVVIPGLYDGRNKAFFFVNYEEFHQPSDTTRSRTVLRSEERRVGKESRSRRSTYRYTQTVDTDARYHLM